MRCAGAGAVVGAAAGSREVRGAGVAGVELTVGGGDTEGGAAAGGAAVGDVVGAAVGADVGADVAGALVGSAVRRVGAGAGVDVRGGAAVVGAVATAAGCGEPGRPSWQNGSDAGPVGSAEEMMM
jgi:hypothetical protein